MGYSNFAAADSAELNEAQVTRRTVPLPPSHRYSCLLRFSSVLGSWIDIGSSAPPPYAAACAVCGCGGLPPCQRPPCLYGSTSCPCATGSLYDGHVSVLPFPRRPTSPARPRHRPFSFAACLCPTGYYAAVRRGRGGGRRRDGLPRASASADPCYRRHVSLVPLPVHA